MVVGDLEGNVTIHQDVIDVEHRSATKASLQLANASAQSLLLLRHLEELLSEHQLVEGGLHFSPRYLAQRRALGENDVALLVDNVILQFRRLRHGRGRRGRRGRKGKKGKKGEKKRLSIIIK